MTKQHFDTWKHLVQHIPLDSYPVLLCPYCGNEGLEINQTSLTHFQTENFSSKNKGIQNRIKNEITEVQATYEQNQLIGILFGIGKAVQLSSESVTTFVGSCRCSSCLDETAIIGTCIKSKKPPHNERIKIDHFSPPPLLFVLDEHTPPTVQEEIIQAFSHFHYDLIAAGNRLRRALEKICQNLGLNEKNLHRNLEKMKEKYPTEAGWLLGLKLIGNEATHSDGISEDDLLQAFKILQAALRIFRQEHQDTEISRISGKLMEKFGK